MGTLMTARPGRQSRHGFVPATNLVCGLLAIVLLLNIPLPAVADTAIRPDSLVFNQTLALADGEALDLPLYFTRRGEYYAEVVLERTDGSDRPPLRKFAIDVTIARDGDVLFERQVETALGRERPGATLFWITTDRELPLKAPLEVALSVVGDAAPEAAEDGVLRFQIRKKQNRVRPR